MMERRHLRYFVEVATTLHVTRASEALHIAQPALTQNINQLEAELGVKLFHRVGRRFTLSEAGKVFLREARLTLRQFDHAVLATQRAAKGELGTLVLGFQSSAGIAVVPQLLQRLRSTHPEIDVILREMGTSAQKEALRAGAIDAALVYMIPDDEFSSRELVPESLVIALPETHPLAQRDSIAFKDLAQETFILPSAELSEVLRHAVLGECADAGFIPKRIQEVSTVQTALGLVSASYGVSVLPGSVGSLHRSGVVLKPVRNSRIQLQIALLWPRDNPSPLVARLLT